MSIKLRHSCQSTSVTNFVSAVHCLGPAKGAVFITGRQRYHSCMSDISPTLHVHYRWTAMGKQFGYITFRIVLFFCPLSVIVGLLCDFRTLWRVRNLRPCGRVSDNQSSFMCLVKFQSKWTNLSPNGQGSV